MSEISKESFLGRWRKLMSEHIADFQEFVATAGILGTVAASTVILANDPTMSAGVVAGLAGNFAANAVERWRNAKGEQEQGQILRQILNEIQTNKDDSQLRSLFVELNLAEITFQSLHVKVEELTELVKAGFVSPEQITQINTGGGSSVQGDANAGRDFVGRDQHNYYNLPPDSKLKNIVTPSLSQEALSSFYHKGLTAHLAGNLILARAYYEKIRDHNPDYPGIDQVLHTVNQELKKSYVDMSGRVSERAVLRRNSWIPDLFGKTESSDKKTAKGPSFFSSLSFLVILILLCFIFGTSTATSLVIITVFFLWFLRPHPPSSND